MVCREQANTTLVKKASLAHSDMATYSASVVENVTYFCVLETQLTSAPTHITTLLATDLVPRINNASHSVEPPPGVHRAGAIRKR